jgi:hypothetical protein
MNIDTTSLTSMRLTITDPGKRPRTADHPVEARYQKLCQAIRGVGPVCTERSTAQLLDDRTELGDQQSHLIAAGVGSIRDPMSFGVSVSFCVTTTDSPAKGGNFQRATVVRIHSVISLST